MRIATFRIEGYKGFRDSGEIRLKPGFNVIVGQNNVGKTALAEALALTFGPNAHRSSKTVPVPTAPLRAICRATVRFEVDTEELKSLLIAGELGDALFIPTGGYSHDPGHHLERFRRIVAQGPLVETDHTLVVTEAASSTTERSKPFLVGYEFRGDERGTYWKVNIDRATGELLFDDRSNYGIGGNEREFAAKLDDIFRSRLYAFKAVRFGIDENVIGTQRDLNPDASNLVQVLHLLSSNPRGCYGLAQEWLANAENGGPTERRANRGIRILMRFFSQVHNTL